MARSIKLEIIKNLINEELERSKLKWHARIWSNELKKSVNINDYILELLKDFGIYNIKSLKIDFETLKTTLYYSSLNIDINIIVIINDNYNIKIPARI